MLGALTLPQVCYDGWIDNTGDVPVWPATRTGRYGLMCYVLDIAVRGFKKTLGCCSVLIHHINRLQLVDASPHCRLLAEWTKLLIFNQ